MSGSMLKRLCQKIIGRDNPLTNPGKFMAIQENPFKKHYETLTILGGMVIMIAGCCMWLSGKFASIEQRLVRIETVLIMQGIMPKELASLPKSSLEIPSKPALPTENHAS